MAGCAGMNTDLHVMVDGAWQKLGEVTSMSVSPQTEQLPITRYDLPDMINQRGYKTGVEVGVEHGFFSFYLLKHSQLERLYSIDPYQGKWRVFLADAESLLQEFGSRSEIHVLTSRGASELFASQGLQFDFVYLDGDHRYRFVRDDISLWWPLVRQGGLLAGHDYCAAGEGVVRAVNEFVERERLSLKLTRETWSTWMVFKP